MNLELLFADLDAFAAALSEWASPQVFGALVALAAGCVWLSLMPAAPARQVGARLGGYVARDLAEREELQGSFISRVVLPLLLGILRTLGRLAPSRTMEATQRLLIHAGEPGKLTVLDFYGLRILTATLGGGAAFWLASRGQPMSRALLVGGLGALIGFLLPIYWLRSVARSRQRQILRALPNALDMLTIGVEAGLAFESAMLRVSERWDNPLTRELRRTVLEMRVGTPRNQALQNLADRTNVDELRTFVAVLVQSSQLGVSIAEVLHSQAAEMREKRRQRAEALAREAAIKMIFPLVFFIFPAMFVVILGPAVPRIMEAFGGG